MLGTAVTAVPVVPYATNCVVVPDNVPHTFHVIYVNVNVLIVKYHVYVPVVVT